MSRISRSDFLKLSAALAASAAFSTAPRLFSSARSQNGGKPNILIFVFDAMSARHLSLYGYDRQTTPNLEKFAARASVYHKHYSTANFTSPGTASLLTGMHPWTHRAFNFRGMVDRTLTDRNLFNLVGEEYRRVAFTQNFWADILLSQFEPSLDLHLPCDAYSHSENALLQPSDLRGDRAMAYYVFQDFLNLRTEETHPFPGSLFIGSAELSKALTSDRKGISAEYPRGLPSVYDFTYENASVFAGMNHVLQSTASQESPVLSYFHFWSPHGPYNPHRDFVGIFKDDLKWHAKSRHPFAQGKFSQEHMQRVHREYDECIAEVDAQFGRVIADLEKSGVLQNSYVIVTSDHGELFERGEIGHASALMYESVTHVPLLISAPGQETRVDVYSPTSIMDILPTILQIAGKEIPGWVEGEVLPGFGGTEDTARVLFPIVAKDNATFQPLEKGTFSMIKGPYELFFFTGYKNHEDRFELYNLEEDPHELQDLFSKDITTASHMKDELLEAVDAANRNYQKK